MTPCKAASYKLCFLSHNFLAFFKHTFPHTKTYGKMQHSPSMYVRSESVLFPDTEGLYTPFILTQTSCSSLHFSFPNCPYPRLSAALIPKASQTPAGPHRLRAGVQTQLPAFQALDTNLLCCSAICVSLKAECREKSSIHNPSLPKQMRRHLKAQRITSSARLLAEKPMYRQLKIFCYRF